MGQGPDVRLSTQSKRAVAVRLFSSADATVPFFPQPSRHDVLVKPTHLALPGSVVHDPGVANPATVSHAGQSLSQMQCAPLQSPRFLCPPLLLLPPVPGARNQLWTFMWRRPHIDVSLNAWKWASPRPWRRRMFSAHHRIMTPERQDACFRISCSPGGG